MVLADRGYDADWIREFVNQQGVWANIPSEGEPQGPNLLQSPPLPGAQFGGAIPQQEIKQCRRIATRYDKLAANCLAFIKLASIRLWLRTLARHL